MRPRVQFSPAAPFSFLLNVNGLAGGKPPVGLAVCGANPPWQGEWTDCRGAIVPLDVANFIYVPSDAACAYAPTGVASFELVASGAWLLSKLCTGVRSNSQWVRSDAEFHNGQIASDFSLTFASNEKSRRLPAPCVIQTTKERANLLATGIGVLVATGTLWVPDPDLYWINWLGLAAAYFLIMSLGIHPLVTVLVAVNVMPTAARGVSTLTYAVLILGLWTSSTIGSPMSANNLMFSRQLGVPVWRLAWVRNMPAALLNFTTAVVLGLVMQQIARLR